MCLPMEIYTGEKFAGKVNEMLDTTVELVKRNELHKFVVLPKSWIVKHYFGRLARCLRLGI